MNAEAKEKLLREKLRELSEHFDYVQIFFGVREEGSSYGGSMGNGEWYARYGATREWVIQQEEQMRCSIRKEQG